MESISGVRTQGMEGAGAHARPGPDLAERGRDTARYGRAVWRRVVLGKSACAERWCRGGHFRPLLTPEPAASARMLFVKKDFFRGKGYLIEIYNEPFEFGFGTL